MADIEVLRPLSKKILPAVRLKWIRTQLEGIGEELSNFIYNPPVNDEFESLIYRLDEMIQMVEKQS
jgi:hypothetical protein